MEARTSQELGDTEVGCKMGLSMRASSEPNPCSSGPPLCLLSFHYTGSGLQQPIRCLHIASSRGTELASSLVPLAYYWREPLSVLNLLTSTRGLLQGHWM